MYLWLNFNVTKALKISIKIFCYNLKLFCLMFSWWVEVYTQNCQKRTWCGFYSCIRDNITEWFSLLKPNNCSVTLYLLVLEIRPGSFCNFIYFFLHGGNFEWWCLIVAIRFLSYADNNSVHGFIWKSWFLLVFAYLLKLKLSLK